MLIVVRGGVIIVLLDGLHGPSGRPDIDENEKSAPIIITRRPPFIRPPQPALHAVCLIPSAGYKVCLLGGCWWVRFAVAQKVYKSLYAAQPMETCYTAKTAWEIAEGKQKNLIPTIKAII